MSRRFSGGKLVIASHNPGKAREIAELLGPYDVEASAAGGIGLKEPKESGATFVANAELKAVAAARASQLPARGRFRPRHSRTRRSTWDQFGALGRAQARLRHGDRARGEGDARQG